MNRWVTLRYEHDGYASIRLYVDGTLAAANYSLRSGVPPVLNTGVNIGNWTLTDVYTMDGAIDEVKIWRWDPDDSWGHFLGRPLDRCTAPCWQQIFEWFTEKLRDPNERQRMINLLRCIEAAQTEMVRLLRSNGEEAITESAKFSEEYRNLWQQGPLNSNAMKQWQKRWFEWLISVVGDDAWRQFNERMQRCLIGSEMLSRLPEFDCDAEFAGYLMGFGAATGNPFGSDDSSGGKGGHHGSYSTTAN